MTQFPGKLRAGLVWHGNPNHPDDARRSCQLRELAPCLMVPGIQWFSLQKGPAAAEATAASEHKIVNLSGALTDFADTAAVIENLDLVVSVDTAVAHLAGSMGKKIFTLLSVAPDWRWMLGRSDSPWYPSMQLFRQPTPGDWQSVANALAAELHQLFKSARQ